MLFWITGFTLSVLSLAMLPFFSLSPMFVGVLIGVITRLLLWKDNGSSFGRALRALVVVSYATVMALLMSYSVDALLAIVAYAFLFDDTVFFAIAAKINQQKG